MTHFKKIERNGKTYYEECDPKAKNAIKMQFGDLKSYSQLAPFKITVADVTKAVKDHRTTVGITEKLEMDAYVNSASL